MKTKLLLFTCIVACFLVITQMPVTAAQENQEQGITSIRPGGTYTVIVQVHKPSYITLPEDVGPDRWEIRAYFYSGTNCYNTGSWWQSGFDWIYSGWYAHRIRPGAWAGTPEDKTFTINVQVVNVPRPSVDIDNGMNNIPTYGSVELRARLLIRNIKHKVDGQYVTFKVSGVEYRYLYNEDGFGRLWIGDGFAYIDRDDDRLVIDQNKTVDVRTDAPASGTIYIPSPINIALSQTAVTEPPPPSFEIPSLVSVVAITLVLVAIVVAIAYIAVSRKTPEEEFEL